MSKRILIAGSGYVGERLATLLRQNSAHEVWTLRRSANPGAAFDCPGDLTQPDTIRLPEHLTHVVFCAGLRKAPPEAYQQLFDEGLKRFLRQLEHHPIEQLLFTSTTGVYTETNGEWVDENSATGPMRPQTEYYLRAEKHVLSVPYPATVARLSGIYGPGRIRLIDTVRNRDTQLIPPPPIFMNHIHVEDIVGALAFLLDSPHQHTIYNITDHEPADRNQVICWLANQLQCPEPAQPAADAPRPERRGGNKRCSNKRLLKEGYVFRFPTYREGYTALLSDSTSSRA